MRMTSAVEEYRLACAAKGVTPVTWRFYEGKLRVFSEYLKDEFGITEVEGFQPTHINQFVAWLRETPSLNGRGKRSTYTIKAYVEAIKVFMSWCIAENLLDRRVQERVAMPKVAKRILKTLNRRQFDLLLAAANNEPTRILALRDQAILGLLLATGIRATELCTLQMQHLHLGDDEQSYILVLGKGDKDREVGPLGMECQKYLRRYLRGQHRAPADILFLGRRKEPLTPSGLDKLLYRLRDFSGRENFAGIRVSAHTFRHTFAVNYMEQGGDIYTLSLLLGHTSVAVTQNYLRDFKQRNARRGQSVLDGF